MSSSFEYGLNAAAKEYDGVNKYIRITDIAYKISVTNQKVTEFLCPKPYRKKDKIGRKNTNKYTIKLIWKTTYKNPTKIYGPIL